MWSEKDQVQEAIYVMANFMCQLGQGTVPRYLVKYQSKCCDGII